MEKLFILDPAVNLLNIQDGIEERINKIQGILNCVIFALEFVQGDQVLNNTSAYHALWAIDGFLEEINCLWQKCSQVKN